MATLLVCINSRRLATLVLEILTFETLWLGLLKMLVIIS